MKIIRYIRENWDDIVCAGAQILLGFIMLGLGLMIWAVAWGLFTGSIH